MRPRRVGFFLNANRAPLGVEFHNAVALGVMHVVRKHGGALSALRCAPEFAGEARAIKNIVTEHQAHRALSNEVFAQQERLSQAIGARLNGVLDADTPLAAVPQQVGISELVARRGDNQHVPDARLHQRGKRVVDHGLVVHGHQLLADRGGQRVQAGA